MRVKYYYVAIFYAQKTGLRAIYIRFCAREREKQNYICIYMKNKWLWQRLYGFSAYWGRTYGRSSWIFIRVINYAKYVCIYIYTIRFFCIWRYGERWSVFHYFAGCWFNINNVFFLFCCVACVCLCVCV